jgi:hypothetical protein
VTSQQQQQETWQAFYRALYGQSVMQDEMLMLRRAADAGYSNAASPSPASPPIKASPPPHPAASKPITAPKLFQTPMHWVKVNVHENVLCVNHSQLNNYYPMNASLVEYVTFSFHFRLLTFDDLIS